MSRNARSLEHEVATLRRAAEKIVLDMECGHIKTARQ